MPLSFDALGVPPQLVAALRRTGITTPFPIQEAALPDAIAGRDVLGRGQTGSGKTLAFGLAMLTRLVGRRVQPRRPLGLVLVPTRELAMQVNDTLAPLAHSVGLTSRLIAGGMPYGPQLRSLDKGVTILVATPGRLVDLVNRGAVDLSDVTVTVLDEADQMADMGFVPVVRELLDLTRPRGQRLLFSATLDADVDTLVKDYLHNPAEHSLAPAHAPVASMDHHVLVVHPADKDDVTTEIAARDGRTIFFVRTQAGADRLADRLASRGVAVGALHGGKSQAVRTRTLESFREGATAALVATDVAARGIHVDGISLVVHVDSPAGPKDYLHRAGRTARAGESGTVVTLTSPKQQGQASALLRRAGVTASFRRVRPGDQSLADVTGAQQPSGVPWTAPTPRATPTRPRWSGQRSKAGSLDRSARSAGRTRRSRSGRFATRVDS